MKGNTRLLSSTSLLLFLGGERFQILRVHVYIDHGILTSPSFGVREYEESSFTRPRFLYYQTLNISKWKKDVYLYTYRTLRIMYETFGITSLRVYHLEVRRHPRSFKR